MRETGENPAKYGWYLDMVREGIPASAGFGIGLERLTRYLAGLRRGLAGQRLPEAAGGGVAVTACSARRLSRSRPSGRGPATRRRPAIFPDADELRHARCSAPAAAVRATELDAARLVPPVFMPQRLEKLIELGREPMYTRRRPGHGASAASASPLPVYLSRVRLHPGGRRRPRRGRRRQAGRLGIPMVIGENVVPVNGYGRIDERAPSSRCSAGSAPTPTNGARRDGGVVVQQSTEDADAEVWNLVYSDPAAQPLLDSGRLALRAEGRPGRQAGAGRDDRARTGGRRPVSPTVPSTRCSARTTGVLRCSSPGTFTEEILRQQIRLMRNNYPARQGLGEAAARPGRRPTPRGSRGQPARTR